MLNLYSVYDEKAQHFGYMFFRKTHAEAIRYFSDGARDKQTILGQHPEDFVLYHLGTVDEQNGFVEGVDVVNFLARGSEFKTSEVLNVDSDKSAS